MAVIGCFYLKDCVFKTDNTALKVDSKVITEFVAGIAVVAGISPSMGWNVASLSPLMALPILLLTTAKQLCIQNLAIIVFS